MSDSETKSDLRTRCLVIGSGPGGASTACLLAEAGLEVLILEEGADSQGLLIEPYSQEEMLRRYRYGGLTAAFGAPRIQYVEACCPGGGSEINSGLYYRLPEEIRLDWVSRFAVRDLSANLMDDCARQIEKDLSVSYMPNPDAFPQASRLMMRGADALSWKCIEAPRWHLYDASHPDGIRQTMSRTYLRRALKAGARLITSCRVNKIKRRTPWIVSATIYRQADEGRRPANLKIAADTVFVCAGSVQTPALLQRSRLGSGLKAGSTFQVHPTVKITAEFPDNVNIPEEGVAVHQVKEFGRYMCLGCSVSSPHYLVTSFMEQENGTDLVRNKWPQMLSYYAMISSEGHGSIRVLPGFHDPLVTYRLTRRDLLQMSLGLRRLARLLFAAGATVQYPTVKGMAALRQISDLEHLPPVLPRRQTSLMTIHLMSSCPMSSSPAFGTTDSYGQVFGENNLFVADASLLCTATGCNPQGTVLGIVRRNILHYLDTVSG